MKHFLFFIVYLLHSQFSSAGVRPEASHRAYYLFNAVTWNRPAWINERLQWASSFDITAGPFSLGKNELAPSKTVECDYVAKSDLNGKTPKFYCELKIRGRTEQVKVKYGAMNGEVYSEVAGSRLLWALGFHSDQVFPVNAVICRSCPSQDPWENSQGRVGDYRFEHAIIERKMDGETIAQTSNQGWNWRELLSGYSKEQILGRPTQEQSLLLERKKHRDALRMLAVFLQHADNKAEQQRLMCHGSYSPTQCLGSSSLVIQDVGAVFGSGAGGFLGGQTAQHSKMNSDEWRRRTVWKSSQGCQGNLGKTFAGDSALEHPQISREGREFLSRLLLGFIEGPSGEARVRELFRLSRADFRMSLLRAGGNLQNVSSSAQQNELEIWVQIFKQKVYELADPNRQCSTSLLEL